MDNSYGLLEVQKANLRLLEEIKRICDKHNISYMLDAGTLLGAIRHAGFIPWDDDADIAMTRSNWEIFKRVAKKELDESYHLLLPEELAGDDAFFDFTPRLIYKASRRRPPDKEDEYYKGKLNHLWVDIFILDKLPNSRFGKAFVLGLQKFIYILAMSHRYKLNYKKYSLFQKICIFLLTRFGKSIHMTKLCKWQRKLSKLHNKKDTKKLYYSNYQPDYIDIALDKRLVSRYIDIYFEDINLSVSEDYEEILRLVYGDYMKLPPKSKRVPSHQSLDIKIYG